jgi:hypothetical protein
VLSGAINPGGVFGNETDLDRITGAYFSGELARSDQ